MPITYHYRNRSPDSLDDLLTSSPPDDSIVLSDLIRTGETSRLRRRGAMRLEPNGSSSTRHNRRRLSTLPTSDDATHDDLPEHTWTVVESRPRRSPRHPPIFELFEDDYDHEDSDSDSGDEMVFSAAFNRAISEQTSRQRQDNSEHSIRRSSVELEGGRASRGEAATPYTLVCGGPIDDSAIYPRSDPQSVHSKLASFILPQQHMLESSSSRRVSSHPNDSNGCSTVIHTHAYPRYYRHQPMWTAHTLATDAVVPLEAMYFDEACAREKLSAKMLKLEGCGCLRIGIGCANCGNPLGFRLTPCKTLKDCLLLRQPDSSCGLRSSPTKVNNGERALYLYTFFCSSTMAPQAAEFPAIASASHRHRDWPGFSSFADSSLLPPPLVRLLSDPELSDSDDDVVIDFRTPGRLTAPSRILGGDITSSPEPHVIHLEPNLTPRHSFGRSISPDFSHPLEIEEDSELGQARASWANVVRGIEASVSSLGEPDDPDSAHPLRRPRGPERRDALGHDAEGELGLTPSFNVSGSEGGPSNQRDVPSILLDEATLILTPPPPQPHEIPPSTLETESYPGTPRQTVWGVSFADGLPSTTFWGRPAEGTEWTWTNEVPEYDGSERGLVRNNVPRRVFDPDGEFLEGLEGEWGEEMARELGFSSMEEKSEGGETPTGTGGQWWSGW